MSSIFVKSDFELECSFKVGHCGLDSNMGNRIYTKSNFGFNFGPSGYMGLKKCTHYKYWLNNYPIQKKMTSSLYEAV